MTTTIAKATLARSRVAERLVTQITGGAVETPLARVEVAEGEARSWRITLARPERQDNRPPLVEGTGPVGNNSSPIFHSQLFGYAAGFQNTPVLVGDSPQRDGPIGRGGTDVDPLFVEIAWGIGSGGLKRMLAHWPMMGASVVVYGSFVEVFAGTFLIYGTNSQADIPVFQADICPAEGLSVLDSGELSIQQSEPIQVDDAVPADQRVIYVPDYARRMRVVPANPETGRPFDFGYPRIITEWFDDLGNVVDVAIEGSAVHQAPQWQVVPARATLVRLKSPGPSIECNEPAFTELTSYVHWRISP